MIDTVINWFYGAITRPVVKLSRVEGQMKFERGKIDWASIPRDSIDEILRQAEICIDGTVSLAVAADQRATTMCGIFGGAALALLAAAGALLDATAVNHPLIGALSTSALLLLVATGAAVIAGRPRDFFVGGHQPRSLLQGTTDIMWMLGYTIEDLQGAIDRNRQALKTSAAWLTLSLWTAFASIPAAALAYGLIECRAALCPYLKGSIGPGRSGGGVVGDAGAGLGAGGSAGTDVVCLSFDILSSLYTGPTSGYSV